MLLTVDMQSEIPIYIQIKNQIIKGIATGHLSAGDSLPSVRQMADDLGINLHTVNKVYTLLRQEGFLTVHRKSGVVVNEPAGYRANTEYKEKLNEDLKTIFTEAFCRGISNEEVINICNEIYKSFEDSKNS